MFPVKGQAGCRPVSRRLRLRICRRSRRWSVLLSPLIFPPRNFKIAYSPNHRQLECCTHSAPPVASATAQTWISGLRPGRPRRLRLSGDGKSFNFVSHSLQYTLPRVWARYQRQPQPSQIFKCTRNSMTYSPCSRTLPTALLYLLVSAGQKEPVSAAQDSCALMGDSRPSSLVFCHAHSAQILEFSRVGRPRTLLSERFGAGTGIPEGAFVPTANVHPTLNRGRSSSRFSSTAMKRFSRISHKPPRD